MNKPFLIVLVLLLIACTGDGYLRGEVEETKDGLTYFTIADDNNGACTSVLFDGEPWPYKTGEFGLVEPGSHEIDCNGTIGFRIPEGVIFRFNYWGP